MFGQGPGLAHQHRRIRPHPLTIPAAQQPADRLTRTLAENVPERDIDAADRVRDRPAAPHPEGVGVQFLADPLRLERILAAVKRLEHAERALHQLVVRERRSPPGDAFVREDGDQRMDAVVRLNLVGPTAFRRAISQTCRPDFRDFHERFVLAT